MSASREKKNRQDLTTQDGYVDHKAQKAAEEVREQRKSKILYSTIAIVFVLVAALMVVIKSGIFEKNATAVTIDGEKFSPAMVDYFYNSSYSSISNSQYASYFGIDSQTPLSTQNMSDLAKMFLGITEEGDMTWDAYFKDSATKSLSQIYRLSKAAEADGFVFDETMQADLDETLASLDSYSAQSGYTSEQYLKMVYGKDMTLDLFKDILKMVITAQEYQQQYSDSLVYTDAELEDYYQGDKECFQFADYDSIYFTGVAPSTTDSAGNTVAATEEEQAAAKQAAADAIADAEERFAAGESLEDIANSYSEIATYSENTDVAYDGSDLSNWVFDEARVEGDYTTIDSDGSYYLVLFHSAGRPEYNTVNVRHILFNADTSALDAESKTYEADSQAIWDEAKEKAEEALAQWKAGDATADSFAALANELSEDPGSNTTGGLYSDISKQSSYVGTFKDWCMDPARQVGDTGIIESTYGYHVMYLDSFGDAYWKTMVSTEMKETALNDWLEGIMDGVEIVEQSGMKYVG